MKNVLLLFSSLILAFALTVGLDRLAGLFQPAKTQTAALIFPPNVEHKFQTREVFLQGANKLFGFSRSRIRLGENRKNQDACARRFFHFRFRG